MVWENHLPNFIIYFLESDDICLRIIHDVDDLVDSFFSDFFIQDIVSKNWEEFIVKHLFVNLFYLCPFEFIKAKS